MTDTSDFEGGIHPRSDVLKNYIEANPVQPTEPLPSTTEKSSPTYKVVTHQNAKHEWPLVDGESTEPSK